jgi:hypothetical protein
MERVAKLRRLNDFRRSLPHVSASALSSILDEISRTGVPDLRSRHCLHEATASEVDAGGPYGGLLCNVELQAVGGGRTNMLVVNPFAMLHIAALAPGFAALLRDRLAATPCTPETPWRIALYSDEVVPGNQLSHDNKRKLWVIYWSFLEFGLSLSQEDAWMIMLAKRSSEVSKVISGMSQVFGALIKLFFGAAVHDFSAGGALLHPPGGMPCRLFAIMGMILQDGGAHKSVWHCKGDAGTKFCMLCLNLYSRESDIVDEELGERLLTCTLVHEDELHFANNDDIRGAARRLEHYKA